MRIPWRAITVFTVLASAGCIVYGFSIQESHLQEANKYIGFGTVGLFLVAMPMFLIRESRGKKVKDYMLTEENIRKMQEKRKENPEN